MSDFKYDTGLTIYGGRRIKVAPPLGVLKLRYKKIIKNQMILNQLLPHSTMITDKYVYWNSEPLRSLNQKKSIEIGCVICAKCVVCQKKLNKKS